MRHTSRLLRRPLGRAGLGRFRTGRTLHAVVLVLIVLATTVLSGARGSGALFTDREGVTGSFTTGDFPSATPKAETLTESFSIQDTTKWNGWGPDAYVESGRLRMSSVNAYPYLTTASAYELQSSHVGVRVWPSTTHGADETYFAVGGAGGAYDASDDLQIIYSGSTLYLRERAGGSTTDVTLAYDATAHAWWRIREAGGTVYWETAPDGITWTVRRSKPAAFALSSVYVRMVAGNYSGGVTGGPTYFDDVNLGDATKTATLADDFTTQSSARWTYPSGTKVESATTQKVAVASYFYPDGTAGNDWNKLDTGPRVADLAIINPASGPGSTADANYVTQIAKSQAAGMTVVGYVATSYAGKSLAAAKAEIDKFVEWYHVDGIFFDQATSDAGNVAYYKNLHDYVKATVGGPATVILNPGTTVDEGYVTASDILVTYEASAASYAGRTAAAWEGNYPAGRFWHIIHSASAADVQSLVKLSKERNVGRLQITDRLMPNPYDGLPSDGVWTDLLNAVGDGALDVGRARVSATSGYPAVASATRYDLSASSLSVEAVGVPDVGNGTVEAALSATVDANNAVEFGWRNGSLALRIVSNGNRNFDVTTPTYDATAHRFWRLRESGGTVYWDASPDGRSWTNLRSAALPFSVTRVAIRLYAGYSGSESNPGSALFDNVNLGRPATLSSTLRSVVDAAYTDAARADTEAYVVPTAANLTDMSSIWRRVKAGQAASAAADAEVLGYGLLDYTDTETGRKMWLLREKSPWGKYWGLYALSRDAGRNRKIVPVPHILAELKIHEQGIDTFLKTNGEAFLLATAHRNANAATDADGDRVSDVANASAPPSSVFQAIYERQTRPGSYTIEPHGFADANAPPMGSAHRKSHSTVEIDPAATSATVARPANLAAGDLMLAYVAIRDTAATYTAPSGWTLLHETNDESPGIKTLLYSKVAGAGEPADYTWSWSSTVKALVAILAYENAGGVDVSAAGIETGTSLTTHETPSITTTTADDVLVAFYAVTNAQLWSSSGATGATDRVLTIDTETGGSASMAVYDNANFTSPVGTYKGTAYNSVSSSVGGFAIVAIKPAGPVKPVDIIMSHGALPQPSHLTALRDALVAEGFVVVVNDGSWPFMATENVQGGYARSLGAGFAHVEQSTTVRNDAVKLGKIATVLANFSP